jgi:hypothetical protein
MLQKIQGGFKKAEFYAEFRSTEKVLKRFIQRSRNQKTFTIGNKSRKRTVFFVIHYFCL